MTHFLNTVTLLAFDFMAKLPSPSGVPQMQALGYVVELLADIFVPTVLCAIAGRWLDQHYHISPFGILVGLVIALVLVAVIIRRKAEELKTLFYPPKS